MLLMVTCLLFYIDCFITLVLGLSIYGVKLDFKKIGAAALVGVLQPILFKPYIPVVWLGLLVYTSAMLLAVRFIITKDWMTATLSTVLGMTVYLIIENIYTSLLIFVLQPNIVEIADKDPWLRFVYGCGNWGLMLLLSFIILKKCKFSIWPKKSTLHESENETKVISK